MDQQLRSKVWSGLSYDVNIVNYTIMMLVCTLFT